jgi:hypothetical protein
MQGILLTAYCTPYHIRQILLFVDHRSKNNGRRSPFRGVMDKLFSFTVLGKLPGIFPKTGISEHFSPVLINQYAFHKKCRSFLKIKMT